MSKNNPEIYISYKTGGKSEQIADQLQQVFAKRGLTLIRDNTHISYKESIRNFMQRLGQGRFVILIISNDYLKSKNCMFELCEIQEQKNFYGRVFPLVLEDAKIYDPVDILDYVHFWEKEIETLENKIRESKSTANLQGIREWHDHYVNFREKIAGLTDMLQAMNTLSTHGHAGSDFKALIQALFAEIKRDAEQNSKSGKAAEPSIPVKKLLAFGLPLLVLIALGIIFLPKLLSSDPSPQGGEDDSGYSVFQSNGKFGYLDANRNVVIDARFDKAGEFENGLAEVMENGFEFLIDLKGKCVKYCNFGPDPAEIENTEWESAKKANTVQAFNTYLLDWENGSHAEEARNALAKLDQEAWEAARQTNDIIGFQKYLDEWPEGKNREEAQRMIANLTRNEEQRNWANVLETNTIERYREFLESNPGGEFAELAKQKIKEQRLAEEWERALEKNTENQYQAFLNNTQNPGYRTKALAQIRKITGPEMGTYTFDGKTYRTVRIYDQVWLAENLAYETPGEFSWDLNLDPANRAAYGRLYTWQAAVKGCQALGNGWELASDADWVKLKSHYNSPMEVWKALGPGGTMHFNVIFSGNTGGELSKNATFYNKDATSGYWTSTPSRINPANSINHWFTYGPQVLIGDNCPRNTGLGCRCIRR
ncbi:MAG: TIR domain-containing protein [Bacteroidia bacterium]|nr:TIR domain-containing protein [Bacteroidia bacterium]